jgi:hypothetical protein
MPGAFPGRFPEAVAAMIHGEEAASHSHHPRGGIVRDLNTRINKPEQGAAG